MSPQLLRIMFFIAMKAITQLSLKWLWRMVCHSSLKYEEEVLSYQLNEAQNKIKYARNWLIDTSPTPYKTLFLYSVHSLISFLPMIGAAISLIALFAQKDAFDRFLNILGAVVGGLFVLSLIGGFIYKFVGEKNDLEKIKNRGITNYDSHMLSAYAGNRMKARKGEFVFSVSMLPQYIFLCLWLAGFVFMGYMLVADKAIKDGKIVDSDELDVTLAVTQEETESRTKLSSLDNKKFEKIISVFKENLFQVYDRNSPFEYKYENMIDSFDVFRVSDGSSVDFFLFTDNKSALEFFEMRLADADDGENKIEVTDNEKCRIYRYTVDMHVKHDDGTEEDTIRVIKSICTNDFVAEVNCLIENEESLDALLEQAGILIK